MAYRFYLDNILIPVTPQSLEIKIKNQNKTVTLINDTEYNFLKGAGLTEISFDILLPAVKYPFAVYENGFKNQKYYLDELERLKVSKKPFRFYVSRELPNGIGLYDTDMNVSLEDYTIKESADNGFDLTVSISLKQCISVTTTDINISSDGAATEEKTRVESSQAPTPQNESYIVKKGDTIWALAKYYYGDGSKYKLIASANPQITNPNLIYVGQVLVIPKE
ncbi:MAG TPA: LysM peptidoglycan-binding domain-containing protein [Candidatus Fimicola cottocaccae]|nr:LysM peptidoglycan-binding domain-containing protein [Candidatus Fimicola cottocaccae]